MPEQKNRRVDLDLLKGIAIFVVVLYHLGILKSGYLGVDVFFVIAGFQTVPSVMRKIENKQFSYIKYIWERVIRFLPAILVASLLCIVIGYIYWIPDDYENLAESIIASAFFSNNILQAITTKNYWNVVNDYKPLMHTWYLGILMEFYILIPIITILFNTIASLLKMDKKKVNVVGDCLLTIVSLILFLLPGIQAGDKFYLIQYRFFELMIGGIVGLNIDRVEKITRNYSKWLSSVLFVGLMGLLLLGLLSLDFSNIGVETEIIGVKVATSKPLLLPNSILILLVVAVTSLLLCVIKQNEVLNKSRILATLGRRSYSIFVWHQVLLALIRYSISSKVTVPFLIIFFVLLCIVSELSYRLIESKIKVNVKSSIITVAVAIIICSISAGLYIHAGVVRDVPELGIYADSVHRNMHAEYCDRVYAYNKDFTSTDKIKVLIIGNSYARDFGNILLESEYSDLIELSYSFDFSQGIIERIKQADRILIFGSKEEVPDYLWANVKNSEIVYGIGTKSFGTLNGQVYFKRFRDDYFNQLVPIDPGYALANQVMAEQWGENYIDMMEVVTFNGYIRVFSDANMYISQDTKHLTQGGAQYYARILDLERILY